MTVRIPVPIMGALEDLDRRVLPRPRPVDNRAVRKESYPRMEHLRKKIEPMAYPPALCSEPIMPFQTLIVEDGADYRHQLHEALRARFPSMVVREAGNGIDAEAEIMDHAPDLIFMDINLPGENGLELTKKIKARHPPVVVIILTNYDQPEYREMAVRCQANYFLSKSGTTRDSILALVETLVPA